MTRVHDVAVVGGGVIGLAIAWRASQRGMSVAVIDDEPGRGSSWAAAGMLAPVTEVHPGEEDLLRLNLASAEAYSDFATELEEATGLDVGYRRTGTMLVARDSDDNAQLAEVLSLQTRLGLAARRLRSRECRSLEPALAPTVRGGILVPGDHEIDNRALVTALIAACGDSGVHFERQRAVELAGHDRVEAVVVEDGSSLSARETVVAAGAWTNALRGPGARALPQLRPVKGQLLHLRALPHAGVPRHVVRGMEFYAVPRGDGRLVIGATVEEQGFDRMITAGAVHALLRAAVEVLPDVVEMELTEIACGLRPATADNAPALGETAFPGLLVATGHYRNGILLAPVTADGMAQLLDTGRTPEALMPFSPSRFDPAGVAS